MVHLVLFFYNQYLNRLLSECNHVYNLKLYTMKLDYEKKYPVWLIPEQP